MRRLEFDEAVSVLKHPPGIARPGVAAGPITVILGGLAELAAGHSEGSRKATRRALADAKRHELVLLHADVRAEFANVRERLVFRRPSHVYDHGEWKWPYE